jgi:hypothetical protein
MEATNRMFGMIGMICKFSLSSFVVVVVSFVTGERKLARR